MLSKRPLFRDGVPRAMPRRHGLHFDTEFRRPRRRPSRSQLGANVLGDEPISDAYAANAEFWIRIVRDDLDPYRSGLTDPTLLALIGDCTGLHILDAGCGEGYLTRELTSRGAGFVDGVDTCAEFVAAAASHPAHDPARARFRQADVAALPLPDDSVDLVVANRLPHGLSDPGRRFVEFARVVRPAGRLVMVTMHPCFYVPRGERSSAGTGFTVDDYFTGTHGAAALRGRGDALARCLRSSVVFTGSDDRDAHHRRIRAHRRARTPAHRAAAPRKSLVGRTFHPATVPGAGMRPAIDETEPAA